MTENQTNLPLATPPAKSHPIARGIGAFSAVHFPYSIIALQLVQAAYAFLLSVEPYHDWLWEPFPTFFCALLLMIPYFPLGLLMGRFSWSGVKTRQELVHNTLSQGAIAWGWAAVILVFLATLEADPDLWSVLLGLILPITLFLAFPSCLFVLTGAAWLGSDSPLLSMACWAVLAGALPPLLFNLGNFLAARKRAQALPPPEEGDKKSEI